MDFKVIDGYKFPESTIKALYEVRKKMGFQLVKDSSKTIATDLSPEALKVGLIYVLTSCNGHEYKDPKELFMCVEDADSGEKAILSLGNGVGYMTSFRRMGHVVWKFRELNKGEKVEFNQ